MQTSVYQVNLTKNGEKTQGLLGMTGHDQLAASLTLGMYPFAFFLLPS